jgi:hypothetical protein
MRLEEPQRPITHCLCGETRRGACCGRGRLVGPLGLVWRPRGGLVSPRVASCGVADPWPKQHAHTPPPHHPQGDAKGSLHHAATAPCPLRDSPDDTDADASRSGSTQTGGAGGSGAGVRHSSTSGQLLGSSFLSARLGRASTPAEEPAGVGVGGGTSGRGAHGGGGGSAALGGADGGAGGEGDCSAHSGVSGGAGGGDSSAHSGRGGADDAVGLPLLASSFHSQDVPPVGMPLGDDDAGGSGGGGGSGEGDAHGGSGGGAAGGGLVYVAVPGLSQYVDVLMEAPGDVLPQVGPTLRGHAIDGQRQRSHRTLSHARARAHTHTSTVHPPPPTHTPLPGCRARAVLRAARVPPPRGVAPPRRAAAPPRAQAGRCRVQGAQGGGVQGSRGARRDRAVGAVVHAAVVRCTGAVVRFHGGGLYVVQETAYT